MKEKPSCSGVPVELHGAEEDADAGMDELVVVEVAGALIPSEAVANCVAGPVKEEVIIALRAGIVEV